MKYHDYRNRGWGHDYTFEPEANGLRGRAFGWGAGLKRNDILILQGPSKDPRFGSPYKIDSIKYCYDPSDMWHAELSYAPQTNMRQSTFWQRVRAALSAGAPT